MKKIFILLLLTLLSLNGNDTNETKIIDLDLIQSLSKNFDSTQLLEIGTLYLQSINNQENKDKVIEIETKLKKIVKSTFTTINSKINHFNVQKAQSLTYEVRVLTKDGTNGSGTAIALSSDGKLITAYHNIHSYQTITVIDNHGNEYKPSIGKISIKNDLAYLHIPVKNIAYANIAKDIKLGDNLYMLSYEKLLLSGIASQIRDESIIINVEAKKGTSGGGIFNDQNELVSILISRDLLDKTSYSVRTHIFDSITEDFIYKKELHGLNGVNNYNNVHCYDESQLKIWKKHEKSDHLEAQEFHALFIGLCKKVENKDLTTEQSQYIFENARKRLFRLE